MPVAKIKVIVLFKQSQLNPISAKNRFAHLHWLLKTSYRKQITLLGLLNLYVRNSNSICRVVGALRK